MARKNELFIIALLTVLTTWSGACGRVPSTYQQGSPSPSGPEDQIPKVRNSLHRELLRKNAALQFLVPESEMDRATAFIENHPELVSNRDVLTFIDFSKPSDLPRMLLVDLKTAEVESYITTHGSGSGDRYATRFSNQPNSRMSSLGLYLTLDEYDGKHPGMALRLRGLESSNDQAEARDIVIHAAVNDSGEDYASDSYIRKHGRAGRSWGCFAVTYPVVDYIVGRLKDGSIILVFR